MRSRAVLLLLLLAPLVTAEVQAAEPPQAQVPSCAFRVKWIRSDGPYELVRIEDGLYAFAAGQNREVRFSRTLGLARMERGPTVHVFTPPFELKWAAAGWGRRGATRESGTCPSG